MTKDNPSVGPAASAAYLADKQYRDSAKLEARANLHRKYSVGSGSGLGWFDWIGQQAAIPAGTSVLEVGCGTGWLWEQGTTYLPADIDLTLADLSPGMVAEALQRVEATGRYRAVRGQQADAMALPFAESSFDVVLACHMLYHVPDFMQALAEFRRVLRPGGVLVVTTNLEGNMGPFYELGALAFGGVAEDPAAAAFGLDRAEVAIAEAAFGDVRRAEVQAALAVTDVDDLIAALTSFPPGEDATKAQLAVLRELTVARMAKGGGTIHIPKTQGMVRAVRPA